MQRVCLGEAPLLKKGKKILQGILKISTVHILLSQVTVSVVTMSRHKTTYFKMYVLQNEIKVCRNPFRGL